MSNKVIVNVNGDRIKGVKKVSNFSGTEYYSFLGVPYAQPPIGQARFKDPVKIKPGKNNVIDATVEKGGCRQFCIYQRDLAGSEDCLYNNIHTRQLPTKDEPLKPVIAVVHPGGLLFGSPDPDIFGSPDFVMHHDVVFVGIGFRLHFLGFLNLGLKECSGNQGLKDILASLQWIKENISAFGGDPNNVTLLGSSSGSSLVHCLMLSPKSEGLFHKAVLMGMYILNPTLIFPKENASIAFDIAKALDYEGDDVNDRKKLLRFYKTIDIDEIFPLRIESVFDEIGAALYPASPFTHTFDQGENSILPLPAGELAPSTLRVPIMVGFCDKEAAMGFFPKCRKSLVKNFYATVRQNPCGWGRNMKDEELKQMQKQIEEYYLNGKSVDNASLSLKCDILTDLGLSDLYDSLINVIAADLPSSVYVYKFDFESNLGGMKERILQMIDEPLDGTVHGCDFSYLVPTREYVSRRKSTLNPRTHKFIEMFTKQICTFASTGTPNYKGAEVQWEPSTIEKPCYMCFDDTIKLVDGKLNGERMEFSEKLKKQFGGK
ncbi:esterase E4-like [Planococcus citri]|uniref:esterase E4-like n=1 Tax=Planococcus citri TaxID=170843 RepID=UPI0031F93ECB